MNRTKTSSTKHPARWWQRALAAGAMGFMLTSTVLLWAGDAPSAPTRKVRLVLVGDSTVTEKAGWGLGFTQFLKDDLECINTAMGGRSSKSFRDEGRWTNALALKGDYYLIQFGHNNEPGKPGRSTDMPTFVQDMKNYVDEARAIGAKPILITPLTRRQWDKSANGKIKSSLAPYADEVKKIGAEKHVPVLDLHARSIELCEQLGREGCLKFSPMKEGTNTVDGTHLNADGSVMFGRLVVEELRKAVPELAGKLRTEPVNLAPVRTDAKLHDEARRATTTSEAMAEFNK
jgi:pectinesterase